MVKHFLSINDLSTKELEETIDLAIKLKKKHHKGKDLSKMLKNKKLGLIFEKPSLRTRVSFEVGMKDLGGHTVVIKNDEISMGDREDVTDIAQVLSRYLDAVMIRTFSHEPLEEFAQFSSIPVINGLSDLEHPCQTLADLQTIKENFGSFKDLKIAYIGDGNNVAHSLMLACTKLGIRFHLACPKGYEPQNEFISETSTVTNSVAEAMIGADVVYTDVWTSMGQEEEQKKRKDAFSGYQINSKLLDEYSKKSTIVLHCLPAHRGEEITADAFFKHEKVIFDQAENRMHVQKALLVKLLS